MSVPRKAASASGLTLLETLIALTVLGFLMIGLTQGVRVSREAWQAQSARSREAADVDPSRRVLRALLTMIPIQPSIDSASVAIGFRGWRDRIFLVSELPTGLGMMRRADMTIRLMDTHVVLSWVPHRHEQRLGVAAAPAVSELIPDVERIEFAYWGKSSLIATEDWLPEWDDTMLPELIRVRISFAKGKHARWPDLIAAPALYGPS
jgi:general secretion pathway protein J